MSKHQKCYQRSGSPRIIVRYGAIYYRQILPTIEDLTTYRRRTGD